MAEIIQKPSRMNEIWANQGDKVYPGIDKTDQGWIEEVPPHEWFNYLDNKRDAFAAHVNQMGIAVHDMETTYIAGRSVTQGSDGQWYKCKITNQGQDPVTAPAGYWELVPLGVNDALSLKRYVGYDRYASDFVSEVNRRYYLSQPLILTLPSEHSAGDVVTVSKSPLITATIAAPAGQKVVTSLGSFDDATFDMNDEINIVSNGTDWEV